MISNIKLLLVPNEESIQESTANSGLSLALGIITSFLENKKLNVFLKDLNQFCSTHNFSESEINLISKIFEKNRVLNYISGSFDPTLDSIAKLFIKQDELNMDCYGISIGSEFSMLQIHLGFVLAAYIKKTTQKTVIVGGNNITFLCIFKEFFNDLLIAATQNIDFIIKGPGEQTIYQIIQKINNNEGDFSNLPGLVHFQNNVISINAEQHPLVIRPSWGNLDLTQYTYPFMKSQAENETIYYRFPLDLTNKVIQFNEKNIVDRKLFIPYIFNYNCTYNCAFCTQSDTDRGKLIVGNTKEVVDDLEFLSKKYNSNYFYFLNNYFPSSKEYIFSFKTELENRNLKIYWSDCGRANGLTYEKLKMMYEAGCRKLVFGFESGSNKILKLVNKQLDLSELQQVLIWCKEIGIWADLEVIIGLPHENYDDFMDTYNFIQKNHNLINNFWLNEFFVVPNSLIGRHPENYDIELLKNKKTYNDLLIENQDAFLNKTYNPTANAHLWGFNEINKSDERKYEEIRIANKEKLSTISKIRNPEFNRLFDFYNKMILLRNNSQNK